MTDYEKLKFDFKQTQGLDETTLEDENLASQMTNTLLKTVGLGKAPETNYDELEFILDDDPSGGEPFGSKLTIKVGTCYLIGALTGSAYGLFEGLRNPQGTTFKLTRNAVLNSMSRHAPFYANNLGVVSIFYYLIEYAVASAGLKHDLALPTLSATLAGALFKSTAGWKSSGRMGLLCGSLMGAYSLFQHNQDRKAISEHGYKM